MIPRDCSDKLTMSELRIKASSEFFGPSCKAGIWDEDNTRDKNLSEFLLRILLKFLYTCNHHPQKISIQSCVNCVTINVISEISIGDVVEVCTV